MRVNNNPNKACTVLAQVFDVIASFAACVGVGVASGVLLILVVLMLPKQAQADNHSDSTSAQEPSFIKINEITRGSLLFKQTGEKNLYTDTPSLNTAVTMKVSGMLAHVEVEQTFRNTTDTWQEGIYVFPLPDDSAVNRLRMRIGERIIEGVIKEKAAARKTYEKAKKQGKKAALVEQRRPNMFINSVANIGPGESVSVTIHYQQRIQYTDGEFSLRFPMIINPRYTPNAERQIADALSRQDDMSSFSSSGWANVLDRFLPGDEPGQPVSIGIDLEAGFSLANLESPYHVIEQEEQNGHHLIRLANTGVVPADRDFVLRWRPVLNKTPQAALFSETVAGENYALLMLMPPHSRHIKAVRQPREINFIIDTSGSMSGVSIRQAKQALELAVKRLGAGDRFNIIEFNSISKKLYADPVIASERNVRRAIHYIQSLRAGGGTEMYPALLEALMSGRGNTDAQQDHLRQVIFLTDGSVSNESQLFGLIHKELADARLFTVGIGSAPNSHFMHKAALFGRGTYTYIGKVSEVEEKMLALFEKIENPVLTNITLEWGKDGVWLGNNPEQRVEVYPGRMPDLYSGEPLVISAKLPANIDTLRVSGKVGTHAWSRQRLLQGGAAKTGVAKRWAREKIAALMNSLQDGANKDDVKQAVTRTALKHHLVSKYTSLVAVDVTPSRPKQETLNSKKIKTPLPAGSTMAKQVNLPQTATNSRWHSLLGLLFLVIGFLGYMLLSDQRHGWTRG